MNRIPVHFTSANEHVVVRTYETVEQVADIVAEFIDEDIVTGDPISVRFCLFYAGRTDDPTMCEVQPLTGLLGGVFVDADGGVFADRRSMWHAPDVVPEAYISTAMSTVPVLVFLPRYCDGPIMGRFLGADLGWRLEGSPSTWHPVAWQPLPLAPVRRRAG